MIIFPCPSQTIIIFYQLFEYINAKYLYMFLPVCMVVFLSVPVEFSVCLFLYERRERDTLSHNNAIHQVMTTGMYFCFGLSVYLSICSSLSVCILVYFCLSLYIITLIFFLFPLFYFLTTLQTTEGTHPSDSTLISILLIGELPTNLLKVLIHFVFEFMPLSD